VSCGELVGYMLDSNGATVRVIVPQSEAELVTPMVSTFASQAAQ
jgi:hypothetical protein